MREKWFNGFSLLVLIICALTIFFVGKEVASELRISESSSSYIANDVIKRFSQDVALLVQHNSLSEADFKEYHKEILLEKINKAGSFLYITEDNIMQRKICGAILDIKSSFEKKKELSATDNVILERLKKINKQCASFGIISHGTSGYQ